MFLKHKEFDCFRAPKAFTAMGSSSDTTLNSEASCRAFIETHDASTIARQLQRDQETCLSQSLPSSLAVYLPSADSQFADAIAAQLHPETARYGRSIRMIRYTGIVQGIKAYLAQMTPKSKHGELPAVSDSKEDPEPSRDEIETALKILEFAAKSQDIPQINIRSPLEDVVGALRNVLNIDSPTQRTERPASLAQVPIQKSKSYRKCYICQFLLITSHPQYQSLCKPCGEFNLASCSLSLPQNLRLNGKTALVTGARVNLGFQTALRLLRCGARVIVSSRYPRDAEVRYLTEKDSGLWCGRLRIVGADFRAASDVFRLVGAVNDQLKEWDSNGKAKLDILVNNAAQTLTDPLEKEREAVEQEKELRLKAPLLQTHLLLAQSEYTPRIRGGAQSSGQIGMESHQRRIPSPDDDSAVLYKTEIHGVAINDHNKEEATSVGTKSTREQSSWMQTIHQIPYEDVISAHSVNTFVPLILIRELLPLMGALEGQSSPSTSSNQPSKPIAHIINVTSREGVFESSPNSSAKNGHHVHTNLTKAALNMLTETEAGPAWKNHRVAINSVDPGYMSAAPEIEAHWKQQGRPRCPIGWEDGAGRVLWPVAVGENGEGV